MLSIPKKLRLCCNEFEGFYKIRPAQVGSSFSQAQHSSSLIDHVKASMVHQRCSTTFFRNRYNSKLIAVEVIAMVKAGAPETLCSQPLHKYGLLLTEDREDRCTMPSVISCC